MDGEVVDLPLRLMPNEPTPLYLQIVHQLKQLIITHRLDDGARLPAVRSLAEALAINPGTVVQAYRELANDGLVESVRGRGTIVRRLSSTTADELARTALLERAATTMVNRARALGFSAEDARQQLGVALLAASGAVPVVFVGVSLDQAQRYVTEQLEPRSAAYDVTFVPFGLDDVLKASPALLAELQTAYTVVTFVTTAPEVERSLAALGIDAEIIGVTAELSAGSLDQLHSVDAGRSYALVTEHPVVTTALAIIEVEAGLSHDHIKVVATAPDGSLDPDALRRLAESDAIVIYSFGVADAVHALALPDERRLELRFVLTESALARLDTRWGRS